MEALFTPESLISYQAEAASAQMAYDEALLNLQELGTITDDEEPPVETDLVLARRPPVQSKPGTERCQPCAGDYRVR